MPARPTSARWKRAYRLRWEGRSPFPSSEREKKSRLRRGDHFLDQAAEATDIAGRIDGVAEPDDHQTLRRNDHDALAEIAGGKKGVARDSEPDAPLGMFVLAAIGPEAGAIVGVQRGGG